MLSDARIRPLVKLLFVAVALILFNQLVEVLVGLGQNPGEPGSPSWRIRSFTVLAGRAGWLVVADALLFAAVVRLDSRRGLRVLGWFNLGLGLAALGSLLMLARDGMRLRSGNLSRSAELGVVRAGVPFGLVAVIALFAGWLSVRRTKKPDWGGRNRPVTPLLTDTARAASPTRSED